MGARFFRAMVVGEFDDFGIHKLESIVGGIFFLYSIIKVVRKVVGSLSALLPESTDWRP